MQVEQYGSSLFRQQIVAAVLSGRPLKLSGIHPQGAAGDHAGLTEYEANFLKFIDRVTNGTKMAVSDANQTISLQPGFILGGTFSHAVPASRGVGYIIEAALLLLPFAKYPSEITFTGATQHPDDLSVDTIRTVTIRWLQLYGVETNLRVVRRGAGERPDGCVILSVNNVRKLNAVNITERGKIKRIRGIAFASNTAPNLPNRCATSAKGVLLNLLPDVYVVTDISNKKTTGEGNSSGYGVVLVAESTSKLCVISQETTSQLREVPEDVGQRAARLLLEQVMSGGCVDAVHQYFTLMLCALAKDDLSTLRFGALTDLAVSTLGILETYFGVTVAIKEEPSAHEGLPPTILVSMMGSNSINIAKRSG